MPKNLTGKKTAVWLMLSGNSCRYGKFCRFIPTKFHNKRLFAIVTVVNFGSIRPPLAISLLNNQSVYQLAYLLLSHVLQRNIKSPWRMTARHGMI